MREWHLYLLRTARGALYTGITTDVARRVRQHARGTGAKALRAQGPLTLVYQVTLGARGPALRVEHAIKQLAKAHKELLVSAQLDAPALIVSLGLTPVSGNEPRHNAGISCGIAEINSSRRRTGWSDS